MLKFGILGLGQAGSNIAEYAITKNFKAIAVNTAKVDLNLLKYIPESNRLYLEGYNGAGRNREIGKEALIANANKLLEMCNDKLNDCDSVFVVCGGGGGTGSGSIPIAIDILQELYSIVNVIYILPDNFESPSAKMNAYDCFSEISENPQIGSIFVIDNQKGKELNKGCPKFKVQQLVNKQIIDYLCDINELTERASYTNNFDNRDLIDILSTRGCTLISKVQLTSIKKLLETDVTANIQQSWNKTYSPIYNLDNIVKAAILGKMKSSSSNKINIESIFNSNIPYDIKDSFYNCKDENATIYTILSGLTFPENRLNSMKEDISKVQDNLVKRLEISQTQKLNSIDWKINIPKIDNQLNKSNNISLSEKLQKYK